MNEPVSLFPAWLVTLRDATGYDLTPDREVSLMDAVHAMGLDEDTMMLTAESLIAKWPIKGFKLLDATYRAWLRRERIRLMSAQRPRVAPHSIQEYLQRKAETEAWRKANPEQDETRAHA